MKTISALSILCTVMFAWGCEDKPAPEPAVDSATAEAARPSEKTAEEKAAAEASAKLAAEEERKKEESAKVDAELAENPMTECCRALSAKGFTLRSAEYMTAAKTCGEALAANKQVSEALPDIKKQLGSEPVPDQCAK